MIKRLLFSCLLLLTPLCAQNVEWDSTGNGLLNGQFRFREVIWITDEFGSNRLSEAVALWGTITFDGSGNYTISGQVFSGSTNPTENLNLNGTYAISASGLGFIRRPIEYGGWVYGTISNGVFIGSTTEDQLNDLFIAAQAGGTPLTTATFNQNYTLAYVNLPGFNMDELRDVMFRIQGNGAGGLAVSGTETGQLSGKIAGNLNPVNQTINGSTYSFTGGIGTLNFNATAGAQILVAGSKQLYASADGAFVFGGSITGFDMFVGIRTPLGVVSPSVFDYLYYQAGIEVDTFDLPGGPPILDSYWGAFTPRGNDLIGHQRVLFAPDTEALDFTYSDDVALNPDGTDTDYLGYLHIVSADGRFRVGVGGENFLGINVSVKAPVLQGSGVFLNPVGVVNAASFTPFTVGVSPGAVITLFGTGIAETVALDSTFPFTLNGLEVRINGEQARIYKTSPGEVSVVVPYDLAGFVAQIQVFRNGTPSNRVTAFLTRETPGFFTQNANGLGYAAALHPDFSLVTPARPAAPGEIIAFFLAGMGATDPPVEAGTPGPVNPFSLTTAFFSVRIQRRPATIHYSGLAPFLGGLYQLNVQIPAATTAGDVFLELLGPNSFSSQAQLPVGALAGGAQEVRTAREPARARSLERRPSRPVRPSSTSPHTRPGASR